MLDHGSVFFNEIDSMYRLTALLGAGIYLAMLVGGTDHGQRRFGLMPQPQVVRQTVVAAAEPAPAAEPAAFVPSQPVMVIPAVQVAPAEAELPDAPAESAGAIRYVNANANLREGPGTDFAVLGRLSAGEAVLVVDSATDGWSRVRIEGDGGEGFVATRLLSE